MPRPAGPTSSGFPSANAAERGAEHEQDDEQVRQIAGIRHRQMMPPRPRQRGPRRRTATAIRRAAHRRGHDEDRPRDPETRSGEAAEGVRPHGRDVEHREAGRGGEPRRWPAWAGSSRRRRAGPMCRRAPAPVRRPDGPAPARLRLSLGHHGIVGQPFHITRPSSRGPNERGPAKRPAAERGPHRQRRDGGADGHGQRAARRAPARVSTTADATKAMKANGEEQRSFGRQEQRARPARRPRRPRRPRGAPVREALATDGAYQRDERGDTTAPQKANSTSSARR